MDQEHYVKKKIKLIRLLVTEINSLKVTHELQILEKMLNP